MDRPGTTIDNELLASQEDGNPAATGKREKK
jgi:hypothetical protein